MKARLVLAGVTAVLLGVAIATLGAAQEQKLDVKRRAEAKKPTVMPRKLLHSQKVLEGLALADFDKIGKGAEELRLCAQEASWMAVATPKYRLYSNDFVRDLEGMKKAAKDKNVDAAALAYVDLTLTCVKCHQHVREERIGIAPAVGASNFAAK
ncbi:MAG TPA: hypothetical protein VN641_01520 [Urbifossiella sp.]|nr:hypothetical protein [Urbifossiella sp.]